MQRMRCVRVLRTLSPSRQYLSHSGCGSAGRAAAQVTAERLCAATSTSPAAATERGPLAAAAQGRALAAVAYTRAARTAPALWCSVHSHGEMGLLSHFLLRRCYPFSSRGRRSLHAAEGVPLPPAALDQCCCNSSSGRWCTSRSAPTRTAAVHKSGVCVSLRAAASLFMSAAGKKKNGRTVRERLNVAACVSAAATRAAGAVESVWDGAPISSFSTGVLCPPVRRRVAGSAAGAASLSASSAARTFSTAAFSTAAGVAGAGRRGDDSRNSETLDGTGKESPSFDVAGAALLLMLALSSSKNNDSNSSESNRSSGLSRMSYAGSNQQRSRRRVSALLPGEEEEGVFAGRSVVAARRSPPSQCCSSAAPAGSSTYKSSAALACPIASFPAAATSYEAPAVPTTLATAASALAASGAGVRFNVPDSCGTSTLNNLNVAFAAAAATCAAAGAEGEIATNAYSFAAGPVVLTNASVVPASAAGQSPAATAAQHPASLADAASSSCAFSAAAPAAGPSAAAAAAAAAAEPSALPSSSFSSDSAADPAAAASAVPPAVPAGASSGGLYQELSADSALQLFSGATHPELAREIAAHLNVSLGRVQLGRFLDGECLVRVLDEVRGRDVFVIQSAPAAGGDVHSSLVELFLLITTLRRASAKRVTAVMPYLPYGRETELKGQRDDICTPMAAADLAVLLQVCGADAVIFVDVHNPRVEGFFTLAGEPPIPMSNIDPHGLAAQYFRKKDLIKPVVVATDNTAGEKASSMWTVMKQYGINAGFTSMVCDAPKRQVREGAPILPPSVAAAAATGPPRGLALGGRAAGAAGETEQQQQQEPQLTAQDQNADELTNWNLLGAVEGCDCVIVDDIIDTAEKAEGTARDLKAGGARRIFMFASHGILSKGAVDRINNSPIEEVVVTNTVPIPPHIYCEKLVVLSVGKLLAEAIKRVHEEQSVSVLCSRESRPRSM